MSSDTVNLLLEGSSLICSKTELAKHSDYFKAMFEGNFTEKDKDVVKLEGVEFKSMKLISIMLWDLDYILADEDILHVLQAACMLQFEVISTSLIDKLTENLKPSNCIKVWFTAEMLNIHQLHLKAKNLALMEFSAVRKCGCLLELNFEQLHTYLANIYLSCKEFEVFTAFMEWHFENGNNILDLLYCLDFNRLSDKEIGEMMLYPDVKKCNDLVNVLQSVINIRSGASITNDLTKKILGCNRRSSLVDPLFFVKSDMTSLDEEKDFFRDKHKRKRKLCSPCQCYNSVLTYDQKKGKFWKTVDLCKDKFNGYSGYELIGYKEQIFLFGGEVTLGTGHWNTNFWVYDTIRERWELKSRMPMGRRHFQTCIIKHHVFIVGGIGRFRVIQDNMFTYNYKDNTWSKQIMLPCSGLNVKCCNYKDRLFLFYMSNKCGYLYYPENSNFVQLNVTNDFPNIEGKYGLYCFDDRIFIKDATKLVEMGLVDTHLNVVNTTSLQNSIPEANSESVLCNDTIFTMYKNENGTISVERLNLVTLQSDFVHKDLAEHYVGRTKYLFHEDSRMFALQHHNRLAGDDILVNTID